MLQPIHWGHRIGYRLLVASAILALIVIDSATAQTTAFTYQGKLNDNGNPASGQYDFQFKLFDTATVGTVIKQLRPISFTWKRDGKPDVGFGAEDVAAIEPLLVTHNEKGEVEGVKYDRITAVLINAIKQQQTQITQQQAQIEGQQQQLKQQQRQIKAQQQEIETLKKQQQEFGALKRLVCADRPYASICKSK